jgi:predicted outer membrane repeat protein
MKKHACLLVCLFVSATLMLTPPLNAQTIWWVDDDAPGDPGPGDPDVSDPLEDGSTNHPFDAIQEAIDMAADMEYVVVESGTYTGFGNKNIDFGGKIITVAGLNGPEETIIDMENDGRAFHFQSGEKRTAQLAGFSLVNGGLVGKGGAIYCHNGSRPQVINCVLRDNRAENGGAVYISGSRPKLVNCEIRNNTSTVNGGGIYCRQTTGFEVSGCVIEENTADTDGGGIFSYDCELTVFETAINGNTGGQGGGIHMDQSDVSISRCMFSGNSSSHGGAIFCHRNFLTILGCFISGNSADGHGGGMFNYDHCFLTIHNCAFVDNTAGMDGGGFFCRRDGELEFRNCTMVNNISQRYGGGLFIRGGCYSEAENLIIWNNQALEGDCIYMLGDGWEDISQMLIRYSNLAGDIVLGDSGIGRGSGMIDADPLFTSGPQSDYYLSQVAAGQSQDSPCVNGGTPGSPMVSGTTRSDEGPDDGVIDMGYHHNHFSFTAPALSYGAVSPLTNYYGTLYEYTVRYVDEGGNPPATIYVNIDGAAHDMSLSSGFAAKGWYVFKTRDIPLDEDHTYYFYAESTEDEVSRLPEDGVLSGPYNAAPELFVSGDPVPGAWMRAEILGVAGGLWTVAGSSQPGPFYVPATGITFDIGPGDIFWIKKINRPPLHLDEFGYGVQDFPVPTDITPGTKYLQGATNRADYWAKTNQVTIDIIIP